MTLPNVVTRDAGRDLDALVAEKVMGWKRNKFSAGLSWDTPSGYRTWEPSSFGSGFQPSVDIAVAWEVVEKIVTPTRCVDVRSLFAKTGPDPWECFVYDEMQDGDGVDVSVEAQTAPLAICLAALKLVGA